MPLTSSQTNRLGERIRKGAEVEGDMELLEQMRQEYAASGEEVLTTIGTVVDYSVNRREGKLTHSIRAKLQREKTRLSKMQDIVGGRITVENLSDQDAVVESVCRLYPDAEVQDFREESHHGYRAIHVIIEAPKPVEIQIRTNGQNRWAQLSERLADIFGLDLKYGAGDPKLKEGLAGLSRTVYALDLLMDMDLGEEEFRARYDPLDEQIDRDLAAIKAAMDELQPPPGTLS